LSAKADSVKSLPRIHSLREAGHDARRTKIETKHHIDRSTASTASTESTESTDPPGPTTTGNLTTRYRRQEGRMS
jgi:hypothetical protein